MSDSFTTADWEWLLESVARIRERMESGDLRECIPCPVNGLVMGLMNGIEAAFQNSDQQSALVAARQLSKILVHYVTTGPL